MRSQAIVFPAPYEVELREIDVPPPGEGQVLVRTRYTGVSTGTETRVWAGKQWGAVFPLVPGYEAVGEVIAAGAGVDLPLGTRVFHGGSQFTGPFNRSWGGQVAVALIAAAEAVSLPDGVDARQGLYLKTGAIALHGVRRASVRPGETVVVVGQGLIGHLAAQAAKAQGATVIAVDPLAARLQTAAAAGVDHVLNPAELDIEAAVKELTGGGADVAIDATGVAAAVDGTARLLRVKPWAPPYPPSGRLVLLGSYTEPVAFAYSPSLFDIEPDIFPSRDCTRDDMVAVAELIERGLLDPRAIPELLLPVGRAIEGYRALVERSAMRLVFDWGEA
jgi:2-desacetyl-2-hydroxyethyl bacteriochlorophyllide A dehydrogenase